MAKLGFSEWIAVGQVIASGRTVRYGEMKGPFTDRFERRLAEKCGVDFAHTVNSGTSALICALVGAGVGPGDEVLVPAYTWVATAAAVASVGAVPVLVEINETMTMDPEDLESRINENTRAIIPVHMINLVCDMDAIMEIARRRDLIVIEDACQAVGVTYKGRRVGSIGHVGAFSFNLYKNMNIGEGGAIITNDERIYARARMYHDVGSYTRGHDDFDEPVFVGQNFKATEFDGAMLGAQLSKLDPLLKRMKKRRKKIAEILAASDAFDISPHNDPENAVGLTVRFSSQEQAAAFANRRGVFHLFDRSRHIYTNWEPIVARRAWHPMLNPWSHAKRDISYSAQTCPKTLDLLSRVCQVSVGAQYPSPLMSYLARTYVAASKDIVGETISARA